MSKLDAALDIAARDFLIFPLTPNGKTPALEGDWKRHATNDCIKITEWWTRNPDYNIGLWAKGMLILDFDVTKERPGRADFEALKAKGLDVRACVRTPSGGRHVYLKMPAGAAVANATGTTALGKGVDVRGDGGYVVAAGSIIDGKAYEWI